MREKRSVNGHRKFWLSFRTSLKLLLAPIHEGEEKEKKKKINTNRVKLNNKSIEKKLSFKSKYKCRTKSGK